MALLSNTVTSPSTMAGTLPLGLMARNAGSNCSPLRVSTGVRLVGQAGLFEEQRDLGRIGRAVEIELQHECAFAFEPWRRRLDRGLRQTRRPLLRYGRPPRQSLLCLRRLSDLPLRGGLDPAPVHSRSIRRRGRTARTGSPSAIPSRSRSMRDARLRALLGVGASQSRHHRRHRARDPDGGHRRHHPAHPRRQRRRDAAALLRRSRWPSSSGCWIRSRRAASIWAWGARRAPTGEPRSRLNPMANERPAVFPNDVRDLMAWVSAIAAARGPSVRCGEGLSPGRDVARDLDARQLRLRRPGGGTLRPALCVRVVLHRRQGRPGSAEALSRPLQAEPAAIPSRTPPCACGRWRPRPRRRRSFISRRARTCACCATGASSRRSSRRQSRPRIPTRKAEAARIADMRKTAFVGTGAQVAERINELAKQPQRAGDGRRDLGARRDGAPRELSAAGRGDGHERQLGWLEQRGLSPRCSAAAGTRAGRHPCGTTRARSCRPGSCRTTGSRDSCRRGQSCRCGWSGSPC